MKHDQMGEKAAGNGGGGDNDTERRKLDDEGGHKNVEGYRMRNLHDTWL